MRAHACKQSPAWRHVRLPSQSRRRGAAKNPCSGVRPPPALAYLPCCTSGLRSERMPISILVADEELWAFRQIFQEACGGEARLIPAWPIALAQDLIRRAQPDWIFLGAGDSG